jgi:hypothetical protein
MPLNGMQKSILDATLSTYFDDIAELFPTNAIDALSHNTQRK